MLASATKHMEVEKYDVNIFRFQNVVTEIIPDMKVGINILVPDESESRTRLTDPIYM